MRRFIFCDRCNPQGINTYDVDRNDTHKEEGHSWYEGTLDEAIKLGWQLSEQGEVLCPHCVENGAARLFIDDRWDSNEIKHKKIHQQEHNSSFGKRSNEHN